MDCLSAPTEQERYLKGNFRLSCRCHVVADAGHVRCHTMRRGHMRIERHALGLPGSHRRMELDPAVTRDGDRILMDGEEVDRSSGPIHGLAMDLGTTTIVLRLVNLETGELIADASFENPQRFAGSEPRPAGGASCPAGPAFEGGAIACGMPALEGAFEEVALDGGGAFRLGVIGGGAPEGLCGSGRIDGLALQAKAPGTGRTGQESRADSPPPPISPSPTKPLSVSTSTMVRTKRPQWQPARAVPAEDRPGQAPSTTAS